MDDRSIHVVTVSYETLVYAGNEAEACRLAFEARKQDAADLDRDTASFSLTPRKVESYDDIPEHWRGALVWGDEKERTVEQLMGAEVLMPIREDQARALKKVLDQMREGECHAPFSQDAARKDREDRWDRSELGKLRLSLSSKLKELDQQDRHNELCPECRAPSVWTCLCPMSCRRCFKGHMWHRCPEHDTLVLGEASHSRHGCCCPEPESKGE